MRIGLGVVLGFILGELTGTPFFFFPPLMAAQFLAMPQPPSFRQGIVVMLLTALTSSFTLFVAGAFGGQPFVYVLLLILLLFFGFLLDSAGKALPATLLLTLAATVPLAATQSAEAAAALAAGFTQATALGVLIAWAMFAVFPATPAPAALASVGRQASPRAALANTAVLLPVLVLFLISGRMTFVVLMVVIAIVRLRDRNGASRAALGLLFGNILGGIAASTAFGLVSVQTGLVFFLLVVLFVGLTFAAQIATSPTRAPIFAVALVTFIILLGLGVSPLPMESGEAFVSRLWNVLLAGVYAVGAISLIPNSESRR